jgi:hypothetical protein
VLWFAAAIMLATSLPYALGYIAQGDQMRFTGFVFGVEDGNSYIAKMLSGSVGAWSFRTPYTACAQRGAPVFLPYLLLGKLAAPPGLHEQLVAIYHLFRILAGFLAILASYDFLALFVKEVWLRRAGTVLVVLGGGLGWLPALFGRAEWFGSLPLEFYSPESFGFLAIYGLPHLALARALLLWGFVAYLQAGQSMDKPGVLRFGSRAGVCWLLGSLAQPLAGLLAGVLCGAHLLALAAWQALHGRKAPGAVWQSWRRRVLLALWAGLFLAPWGFVNLLITRQDPFLQSWMAQNKVLSPPPQDYLLAYGLMLPFTIFGGLRLLQQETWKGWFLVSWCLALPVLAYAPVNLQRRLVEGIWVAIVALSLAAIDRRLDYAGQAVSIIRWKDWKVRAFVLAAILAFPSTAILLAGGFQTASKPQQPAFRPAEEVAVFEYLGRGGFPGSTVLASYETGNALPAWAPVRVVIGHGPESAGLEELQPLVRVFFATSTQDSQREELLLETGAKYVFWGPTERALGSWDPSTARFLQEVYRQGAYRLFEVIEND